MREMDRSDAFSIKLAGKVIRIEPIYNYIQEYCRKYLTEEQKNYCVRTELIDINYEREKIAKEPAMEGIMVKAFTNAYLETLAIYRKIAEKLLENNIILFHGSVVAVDGVGYLFTAKSGTGKSTHTRLWMELFGDRAVMINDDKPLLEMKEGDVYVHGTPWSGKHNLNTNLSVPLKAICILTRAEENHIEKVNPHDIYSMLLQQIYRPTGVEKMFKTMKLVDFLMEKVEFYQLGCNMKREAAVVSYHGMNGEKT